MHVTKPALATGSYHEILPVLHQITDKFAGVGVMDRSSDRHPDDEGFGTPTVAILAAAVLTSP